MAHIHKNKVMHPLMQPMPPRPRVITLVNIQTFLLSCSLRGGNEKCLYFIHLKPRLNETLEEISLADYDVVWTVNLSDKVIMFSFGNPVERCHHSSFIGLRLDRIPIIGTGLNCIP